MVLQEVEFDIVYGRCAVSPQLKAVLALKGSHEPLGI